LASLLSLAMHNTRCGVTPPGTPNPAWACANQDGPVGATSYCAQKKFCYVDANGDCAHGAVVPNSQVTGQWACDQSDACTLQPAPSPNEPVDPEPPVEEPGPIDP
jgi:hypothetical protein